MPVVLAIVQAVMQPAFDLAEVQGTTHSIAPLSIVCGPIARTLGVSGGFGALGPGHRANASIGRAVRLCMMNIGGARPGVSDMALLGHPGKFSFCLAEDTAASPWDPLHTLLGYRGRGERRRRSRHRGTTFGHLRRRRRRPDARPTACSTRSAATIANLGSNNAHFRCGAVAIALNPEHVDVLAAAGLSQA